VGWRERDWAKFTDDERRRNYAYIPVSRAACPPVVRSVLLSAAVAVVGGAAGFGVLHQHRPAVRLGPPPVVYGIQGTSIQGTAYTPGNVGTACTEEAFDGATHSWNCLDWALGIDPTRVVVPPQYQGSCTHLRADEQRGVWVCLSLPPTA
jgi:hypothetical protein